MYMSIQVPWLPVSEKEVKDEGVQLITRFRIGNHKKTNLLWKLEEEWTCEACSREHLMNGRGDERRKELDRENYCMKQRQRLKKWREF